MKHTEFEMKCRGPQGIGHRVESRRPKLRPALLVLAVGALVAGCGEKATDKAATQVAVRVNDSDITVHQLNHLLQQRNIRAEQVDAASRTLLEQLIDQELATAKAKELALDREPRTVLALESARREVLARAYIEHIAQGVPKATDEATSKYFEKNPALFSARKIYRLQEIAVSAPADARDALRAQVDSVKTANELATWVKAKGWRVSGGQVTRPAEQLPMALLPQLSTMKDGDKVILTNQPPFRILFLVGTQTQPVTFEQSKPAIEQFLTVDARRKAVDTNIKALRAAAKVEYQGKYAEQAPEQSSVSTKDAQFDLNAPASGVQVTLPGTAASGVQVNLQNTATTTEVALPKTSSGAVVQLPKVGDNTPAAAQPKKEQ